MNQDTPCPNWLPIPNFQGYSVSDTGLIKNDKTGRIIKSSLNPRYYIVSIKNKTVLIHRAMAAAFIPNPDNKPFVNHINGITTDNSISNIEWVTPHENTQHALKLGLIKTNTSNKRHGVDRGIDTQEFHDKVTNLYHTGKYTYADLCKEFNIGVSTVSRILKGFYNLKNPAA